MNRLKLEKMPEIPYALQEAINRLRVNVSFLGNEIKKIMIVSALPNEGKSFVAMQLWKQMAESGTPTVLLDADLRKSVLQEKYGIAAEQGGDIRGTSHYLSQKLSIEEVIYHTELECGDLLPNIDNVINPSMLLESERFEQLLKYAEDQYRYVFVDAPPLEMVGDGEKIGSLCDGAILVVRGQVTSKKIVKNSIRQLQRAGCPLLGVVLNRVEVSKGKYYYKKYGGKYGGYNYYADPYYYRE